MSELRAYTADVNDVDRAERTVTATINTDALDRYMTVVDPAGAMLDNYRKNPVVLFNHGDGDTPIGKNLWIKASKKKLIAKTRFLPAGMDETADKVFELYAAGFLNAWSVSFNPTEAGPPSPDEIRKRPELAQCRMMYRKWDLLEYSCVTVPGNPEATRQARKMGLALPHWTPEIDAPVTMAAPAPTPLPPLVGRSFGQVQQAVFAELTRRLGEPRRVAADLFDLARGQV